MKTMKNLIGILAIFLSLTLSAQVDTVWVVNGDTTSYQSTSDIPTFVLNTYTATDTNVVDETTRDTIYNQYLKKSFTYNCTEDNENLSSVFTRASRSTEINLYVNNVKVLSEYVTGTEPVLTFDTILNTNDELRMELASEVVIIDLVKTVPLTVVYITMEKPNSVFNNFKEDIELNIYPNPTTDFLNLSVSNTNFTIFNTNGQLVKQGFLNDTRIDVMDLPTGYYVIKVDNVSKTFIKR